MDNRFQKLLVDLLNLTAPSRQERPVADFIAEYCRKIGAHAVEDKTGPAIKGNAGNVLVYPKGADINRADVMFACHMDTVDVGPERKIVVSSKGIKAGGDYPIGLDNRLGVALLLKLLSEVRGNYACAFTTQEEIGMFGAEELKIPKSIKTVFTLDGSQKPGHFVSSTVGCVTFKIILTGLAAHAGIHPNEGRSVIQMAVNAIAKLRLGMPGRNESVNIGVFNAGTRSNVIPAHAEIIGEVRANDLAKVNEVIGKVRGAFTTFTKKYGGAMAYSQEDMFKPYFHKKNSPIVLRAAGAVRAAGLKPEFGHYRGGSDANVFNFRGVPSVNLSIGAHNPHSAQEYALWRETAQAYGLVKSLLASGQC